MKRLGKKGFTLVELMVVIVIIGILVAIIVPSVTSAVNSAKKQSALADAKSQLTTWSIEVATATAGSNTAKYFVGDVETALTEAEALRIAGEKVFMNTELGLIVIENGTARWAEAGETLPPASGDYYYEMKVENVITITKMTIPVSP